ncbi:MAG: hypothetical protein V3V67_18490 [Myxococcota bacterium]
MPEGIEPSTLSLLPALVTIFLAFATRQVTPALSHEGLPPERGQLR